MAGRALLAGYHQYALVNWVINDLNNITVMLHEHHGIRNNQLLNCLFNTLFRLTTNKISKLCITGSLWGSPPFTSGFPPQWARNVVNSNWSYSPETPNLGQIRLFLEPCDPAIWQMTLKNNRAPLLCYFKLFSSFRSHWWIKTGVTVLKRPIWVKFDDFFYHCDLHLWPLTLTFCMDVTFVIGNNSWKFCDYTMMGT